MLLSHKVLNNFRELYRVSPHSFLDHKKNYKTIKKDCDTVWDAVFDVVIALNAIESATTSFGENEVYWNYLSPLYGRYEKARKEWVKIIKKMHPDVKDFYSDLNFPEGWNMLVEDFKIISIEIEVEFDLKECSISFKENSK